MTSTERLQAIALLVEETDKTLGPFPGEQPVRLATVLYFAKQALAEM